MILGAAAANAQTLWNPERFWSQESAYAGSRVCAGCHADIHARQERSAHSASLRPISEASEFTSRLPYRRPDPAVSGELLLQPRPDGNVDLISRGPPGEAVLTLRWAFGGGTKGITPVGLRDGQFVEGRLSWYRSLGGFDLTTGASEKTPVNPVEALGRTLDKHDRARCFGCHTTRFNGDDPAPSRAEMGVRCERCHGPGQEHARAAGAAGKIFHPGKLDAFRQAGLCGACHGRPPADNDFAAIRAVEQNPLTVRFASQRLVLSRCFNEAADGLRCTQCHDPHASGREPARHYDAACGACHKAGSEKVCKVSRNNCASCHMPRQRVMLHSEFADHWIRIVRDGSR